MLQQSRTISKNQMLFSIACFMQSSIMLTSFFTPIGKKSSWLAIIVSYSIFSIFIIPMVVLLKKFPDKNLFEINNIVLGKFLGKTVSVMQLFFFLTLTSLNTRDIGVFLQQTVMTKTPIFITTFFLMFLCAWATRKGLAIVTRYASFFFLFSFMILISEMLLSMNLMNFSNLLPFFDIKPLHFFQTSNIALNIPLGEIVVFLMIHPEVRSIDKSPAKVLYLGSFLGWLNILLVVLHDATVLGNASELFTLPTFETLRMISIGVVLSRAEILFAIMLMILLFFKISFLVYVCTISIANIFGVKDYRKISFVTTALVFVGSFTLFESSTQHALFGVTVAPILWTFLEFFLPFFTLIVFVVKSFFKKRKEQIA